MIRKERAIPSGIRAFMKPKKSGIEEQEQNGVTAPSRDAAMLPRPKRALDIVFWSFPADMKVRMKAITDTTVKIRIRILMLS